MRRDYEAIVLGLGGIGCGALYWLARRLGDGVLGLEQFALGHDRGGSQDRSRIIRYSYHAPAYVRLAADAYRAWAEVEEEAGERLVERVGGLDLFPAGGAIPLSDYTGSLESEGVPFELLDAAALGRRWPQFRLAGDTVGLFQADGGLVRADRANAAHARLARARGAVVRERADVSAVRAAGAGFEVEAGGEVYRTPRLVVAAGAWTNRALAGLGWKLPLTVTQEQVAWFAPPDPEPFDPGRFPVWIWMDEPSFYGFPLLRAGAAREGAYGVKVAQDVGGREVTAETRSFEPDPENATRVVRFLEQRLPAARGALVATKTCLYTLTPDRDFVVDRLPEHPGCLVAVGAGHAFKFASALGRALSELALNGSTVSDVTRFSIERPILAEEDPPKSFTI